MYFSGNIFHDSVVYVRVLKDNQFLFVTSCILSANETSIKLAKENYFFPLCELRRIVKLSWQFIVMSAATRPIVNRVAKETFIAKVIRCLFWKW